MKDNNKKVKKSTALGIFAVLTVIVAIAVTVIFILHDSYGLLQ